MAGQPLTRRSNEEASDQNPVPSAPSRRGKAGGVAVGLMLSLFLAGGAFAVQTRFSDVTDDHPVDAIQWAADLGITEGCDADKFCPDQPLKRKHARVFLERFYDQVLGASGDDQFSNPDFTRADMMVLLKAINDGTGTPSQPTSTEEPEATSSWIPEPEGRIADGRCAPAIVMGIYDWENCAWGVSPDPEMSRTEMRALTQKVWAEMKARGKRDEPPRLTEGYCGADVLGCYLASAHTIRLSEGFTLWTLLHELAHALISDSEPMQECDDDWTHRQPQCSHGDLYRCAADALYVRYGGIESAGVCGRAPSLKPGNWYLGTPTDVEWGIIHASAWILDDNAEYQLGARCETDYEHNIAHDLTVLMVLPRTISEDTVRIRYRFSDEQHLSDSRWNASNESRDVLFWPADHGDFLARFGGADKLHMRIEYGERDVQRLTFSLGDSPALSIVKSACG